MKECGTIIKEPMKTCMFMSNEFIDHYSRYHNMVNNNVIDKCKHINLHSEFNSERYVTNKTFYTYMYLDFVQ